MSKPISGDDKLKLQNNIDEKKSAKTNSSKTAKKHVKRMRTISENLINSELTLSGNVISPQIDNVPNKKRIKEQDTPDSNDTSTNVVIRNTFRTKFNRRFKTPLRKRRKNEYDPEEEARLEKLLFGDANDVISNLPDEESINKSKIKQEIKKESEEVSSNSNQQSDDESTSEDNEKKAAWVDEDDSQYTVKTALKAQNRKLPRGRPEKFYTELLENKYKQLVGTPKWAQLDKVQEDFDETEYDILKHSSHIEKPQLKNLPKGTIEIKALKAINKQTHNEGPIISSLEFHPTSTVALVAGSSGILSLFQVDGIDNNKLHSIQYERFPISKATFLKEGTEVLVGSQFNAHCHSYDLISGKTHKIPLPHGITNMKRYEVSPDGRTIALCGRMGEIYLLTSSTKELIGMVKMNTKCKAVAFTPDSRTIITHGVGNEMYIWDLRSRTCIHRATDDGCLCCSALTVSPNGQLLATGSKEGVVNIYDTNTVLQQQVPQPLKIAMNLVTCISSLKFNPTSEILTFASDRKANAFKMLHIPSFDVFSNFPTFQTTISMPFCVNFSPGSGYLGISNKSNSAFLYRLKHYGNY